MKKEISIILRGEKKKEGAGVKISRIFDRKIMEEMDPFLMMDFFNLDDYKDYKGGFPWHPHRGIETITYLLKGEVYHEDTLKNSGSITDGECQWMISGNGIIHQELMQESPYILGIQLWLNMAKKDKMNNPEYRDLRVDDIKYIVEDGFEVRIIAGEYKGEKGPVVKNDNINPTIIDFNIEGNKEINYEVEEGLTTFIFVIDGEGIFDNEVLNRGNGVLYERDKGNTIELKSGENGLRAILLTGNPLKEPIAWEGPIVMNTKEELDQTFDEINRQEFIRYRGEK